MDNRIGFQTPRTLRLGAGIVLLALALPGASVAFDSSYKSASVPGDFDGEFWNPSSHQLELVSDYIWQGVLEVKKSGPFKFVTTTPSSTNWWGLTGSQEVTAVPTEDRGPLLKDGGDNIGLKILAGKYRFVFFEDTETFSVLPASSPVPSYSSVKLVGSFNDDGALEAGTMTSKGDGVWMATVSNLANGATFLVQADGESFGAHSAKGATVTAMPASLALYGSTEVKLETAGGTFAFTMDFRSNQLSIVQTATNAFMLASAGADGTFACGDKMPGQNLENAGDDWWSGKFRIEQESFTLRFVGRDKDGVPGRWWGFPAGTTISASDLPKSGYLTGSDSDSAASTATVTAGTGDYTFRFNPQNGAYTIRKRDRGNLLKNPSFEQLDDKDNPPGWNLYHAEVGKAPAFDAHSGTNCAILWWLDKYAGEPNLGNIETNVTLSGKGGLPFRVAASFRSKDDAWNGESLRIIVEWKKTASSTNVLKEESVEVLNLGPAWKTTALETTVPTNQYALTAHILFKFDGAQRGEAVLVDDAFAGIDASRTQNFDAWGKHDNFEKIDPDWSVDSGKTIWNTGVDVLGGVVISKYIEGTGNNKAIELFNGTGTDIDFKKTPYYLQQYDNGSTTPTVTIPLTNGIGKFLSQHCYRITRCFDSTNYPPHRDLSAKNYFATNNALTFNGDDVIVLRRGATNGPVVDRVGQVGTNATASFWSRMATDHTLVRNSTVTNGSTNITAAFDLSEWTVLDRDDFTGIGTHSFTDPDAPAIPSGYSLLLNTGARLLTPSFDSGIGDITFLARAQGGTSGADLELAVESAPDEDSPDASWVREATVKIPLSQTNFTRYECASEHAAHTAVRFRHIADGTTNRVRLDDIEIGRAYRIKRTENFAGWTDAAYRTDGSHMRGLWTLEGHVAANGVSGTLAGNLPVDSGSVQSPVYDGGVGEVSFTLCRPTVNDRVEVTLSVSGDGGSTWDSGKTFEFPAGGSGTATNITEWFCVPSNGCVRFECNGGTADAILDDISIGMPSIARVLDFDDLAATTTYKNSYFHKGWTIKGTAINNTTNAWSGNSGQLMGTNEVIQAGITNMVTNIVSPRIETIGSVSFMYRKGVNSGDEKARLKVAVSANGVTWSNLTTSLAGTDEWQAYSYRFPTNSDWHYVSIAQTNKGTRIFIDDITLADFAPVPSVAFSSALDPAYPAVKESFRLTASAYPRNGADILSVTGYVKYTKSGRFAALPMADEGAGDWGSDTQPGRNGGESIISYATVWYGGVGVVDGNPGYAVTNLSTPVTTVTVSSVRSGEVWLNEFSYAELKDVDNWSEDHEFVEICGKAGTPIGNWKIQLAYALSADIAANSNRAIYAEYAIPAGTVIPTNTASGYGFWLLADKNQSAFPNRDGTLDTLDPIDPLNDDGDDWGDDDWGEDDWDDWDNGKVRRDGDDWGGWGIHSHIHNNAGVIRLVNQYGGVMHSISYGAYAENSEHVSQTQTAGYDTNAISLHGTGSLYSDFSWTMNGFTPGTINADQILDDHISTDLMPIWHDPTLAVTTRLQGAFFLFDPENAPQSAAVQVFFAYTNRDFPSYIALGGTLHHRLQGTGAWRQAAKQNDFSGNDNPTNGEAYFAFQALAPYAYERRDTMEYVIEATSSGYADTFLGTEDGTTSVAYETLDEAKQHPFTHYFPLADHIVITNFAFADDGSFVIQTTGDDPLDPIDEFNVLVIS